MGVALGLSLVEKRQVMAGTVQNAGGESIALWEAAGGWNRFRRAELDVRLDRLCPHGDRSLRLCISEAEGKIVVFDRLIHAAIVSTTLLGHE